MYTCSIHFWINEGHPCEDCMDAMRTKNMPVGKVGQVLDVKNGTWIDQKPAESTQKDDISLDSDIKDLYRQATTERSHHYTASVLTRVLRRLEQDQKKIAVLKELIYKIEDSLHHSSPTLQIIKETLGELHKDPGNCDLISNDINKVVISKDTNCDKCADLKFQLRLIAKHRDDLLGKIDIMMRQKPKLIMDRDGNEGWVYPDFKNAEAK